MAYAASGNDLDSRIEVGHTAGARSYAYVVTETEASSAAEYTIVVPKIGTVTFVSYELTVPGTNATMRPTFRTATGVWDGSGAGSNDDANRVSSAVAQDNEQTSWKYVAPDGLMYVRSTLDTATADSTCKTRIALKAGHD